MPQKQTVATLEGYADTPQEQIYPFQKCVLTCAKETNHNVSKSVCWHTTGIDYISLRSVHCHMPQKQTLPVSEICIDLCASNRPCHFQKCILTYAIVTERNSSRTSLCDEISNVVAIAYQLIPWISSHLEMSVPFAASYTYYKCLLLSKNKLLD